MEALRFPREGIPKLGQGKGGVQARCTREPEGDGDLDIDLPVRGPAQQLPGETRGRGQDDQGREHGQDSDHDRSLPAAPIARAPSASELSLLATESLRETSTMGDFAPITMPASSAFP